VAEANPATRLGRGTTPAGTPRVYSIAAHRGFADALVAGLVPRYSDPQLGLARLTLLLPSSRAIRTLTEAFIRHFGAQERNGLLMRAWWRWATSIWTRHSGLCSIRSAPARPSHPLPTRPVAGSALPS
jgi:hypothetical protein